ncbi:hypothetical protein PS15p_212005 [Mucor circinelloides]
MHHVLQRLHGLREHTSIACNIQPILQLVYGIENLYLRKSRLLYYNIVGVRNQLRTHEMVYTSMNTKSIGTMFLTNIATNSKYFNSGTSKIIMTNFKTWTNSADYLIF